MEICYTARLKFNQEHDSQMNWEEYKEWSKLYHLSELVSLDSGLCPLAFEPEYDKEETYNHLITEDSDLSGAFFNNYAYILTKVSGTEEFNLLAVVKSPMQECRFFEIEDFEFVGYDLLDNSNDISALSNCGGFDETFLPSDLNEFGLINEYDKAVDIQKRLLENNPEEYHADCNIFAIWRHDWIGGKEMTNLINGH